MRDNKPLEGEALDLSTYKTSKYGFKFTHPNSDVDGGDFFITEEFTSELFKIINCQSKGRNISYNNSNVKIHQNYVKENFLLFMYLKDEKHDDETIFLFTKNDIEKWPIMNDHYYLNIPKNSIDSEIFKDYKFDRTKSKIISEILNQIDIIPKVEYKTIIEYKTITNLRTLSNLLELWQDTGSIPDHELVKLLLENFDDLPYISLEQFIFLLCITILNEEKLNFEHSIDWAFQYLKNYQEIESSFKLSDFRKEKAIYPTFMVTYNKTFLLCVNNDIEDGILLHIGDIEEYFECFIFKTGKYSMKYMRTGKII